MRSCGLFDIKVRTVPNYIGNGTGMTQTQSIILFEPGNDVFEFGKVLFFRLGDKIVGCLAGFFFHVI